MRHRPLPRATTLALVAVTAAWLVPMHATAGAVVSATSLVTSFGCGGSGQEVSAVASGSPTSQFAVIGQASSDCSARASAFSYLGVVGATAHADLDSGFGESGPFARGSGAGTWTDTIAVQFGRLTLDAARLKVFYNVSATGGVTATGTRLPAPDLNPLATASATISYDFTIGNANLTGSRSIAAFGEEQCGRTLPPPFTGCADPFGTIAGSIDLTLSLDEDGVPTFGDFDFSLTGTARASVTNIFNPLGNRTASANANFGSTLRWMGVTGVQAFDANGQELALPAGFKLGLIGAATGFDYWNAAPLQGTPGTVPEPATAGLLLMAALAAGRAGRFRLQRAEGG